ncbi:hypothetical protein SDRG_02416 [Saprolegnia diclina VS20]|uniref:Major facilitator superfamily associated domain-containing protein n=1 Tax=Saprolegnia diclina (strain VS20) TaxID=1156394 RepID=T0R0R6_SAPDV|nr:hypothetical protein SDRG_02416 [Saprolegnia diclina VS20]EQC40526.1 hypothetical protein SDRG_02416 [Saprolegnia diclina VS20]|eukprot:XP_008606225.1 hypothetical protein SDRG_02416 [Saprolegnia diclina VS20]
MSISFSRASSLWRDTAPKLSSTASDIILEDERYYARRVHFAVPEPTIARADADDGALLPGGPIALTTRPFLGLVLQTIGLSIVLGGLERLGPTVYTRHLGLELGTYSSCVHLGWSCRIFFGIVSDCFPLGRTRRKAYMLLGWTVSGVACLTMAIVPFPAPSTSPPPLFLGMTLLAGLACVLVTVALDAVMVHYAQREPVEVRGRTQAMLFCSRMAGDVVPSLFCGLALQDQAIGGAYSFGVSPNVTYALLTWISGVCLVAAVCLVVEPAYPAAVTLPGYVRSAWRLPQRHVMTHLCVFRLAIDASFYFGAASSLPRVTDMPSLAVTTVVTSCGVLFAAGALWFWATHCLRCNWRAAVALHTLVAVALDVSTTLLVVYDVAGAGYVRLVGDALTHVPCALRAIAIAASAVELADFGNEALVMSVLTTWADMGVDAATLVSRLLIHEASASARRFYMLSAYLPAVAVRIAGLATLGLVPSQKHDVQVLKQHGRSSRTAGVLHVLLLVLLGTMFFVLHGMPLFGATGVPPVRPAA